MSVGHHREREVTLDVDDDWRVPDLRPVVPSGGRVETARHELAATYYDTDRATLRRLGMTLRHRTGGEDAGWHLKVPSGDARTEVHSHAAPGALPVALRRRVAGVVGQDAVRPVATIRTTRRTTRLVDASGGLLVEVADDAVTGTPAGPDAYPVRWREVEVELGDAGDEAHLDAVVALLDGARPAAVTRKISHVLPDVAAPEPPGRHRLVAAYVREQAAAVLLGDVHLRDDPTPASVHATRVATRRLRSTLRLFDHVLRAPAGVDDDLRRVAGLLGAVRDTDVLHRRLLRALADLPSDEVVGPVRTELERELAARRRAALAAWRAHHDEPGYARLMATLGQWSAAAPVDEEVRVHARRILRRSSRTLDRRLAGAQDDAGLHRARKAAKRLRYAADLLAPDLGGTAATARRAKDVQTRLGDHQDDVVARAFLREVARSPRVVNGYTYGRLAAGLTGR